MGFDQVMQAAPGSAGGLAIAWRIYMANETKSINQPAQPTGVRAVIFDISGTVLDYGSRGPVVAFIELFARHGVAVSPEEARWPMGTHKRDHIWTMLSDPDIGG